MLQGLAKLQSRVVCADHRQVGVVHAGAPTPLAAELPK